MPFRHKVKVRSLDYVLLLCSMIFFPGNESTGLCKDSCISQLCHKILFPEVKSSCKLGNLLLTNHKWFCQFIHLYDLLLLQCVLCTHCYTQCRQPCSRAPLIHASARDSWTLTDKCGSASCVVTAPFSWVLVCTRLFLCPSRICFPSPV